jgi:hypothetical protein
MVAHIFGMKSLSDLCLKRRNKYWLAVRRGALAVIATSQRSSGLWFLQTTPSTAIQQFIGGNNPEDRGRRQEIFGFDSITVTWTAFVAFQELFGRLPDHRRIASALTALYHRRTDDGGYGTTSGWRTHHIFATCRHTATALLAFLQFHDWFRPPLTFAQFRESSLWLLNSAQPTGGWPFARPTDLGEDDSFEEFEPLSTACAIAALCEFRRQFSEQLKSESELTQRIDKELKNGFIRLVTSQKYGQWKSHASQRDVYDSAFVTEMICMAHTTGVLEQIVPDCVVEIRKWCKSLNDLSSPYSGAAWPKDFSARSEPASLAASLAMSALLLGERYREITSGILAPEQQIGIEKYIKNTIRRHDVNGPNSLDAWDWINLARTGQALILIKNSEFLSTIHEKGEETFELIQALRRKDVTDGITRQDFRELPKFCRSSVLYTLTYGHPERVASHVLGKWYQERHPIVRQIINGAIWSALAGVVLWLWQFRAAVLNFLTAHLR